jgi:hypothetical protein
MSKWSHVICEVCWSKREKGLTDPIRVVERREETCCFCGELTTGGIYVRADPALTKCGGNHFVKVESIV